MTLQRLNAGAAELTSVLEVRTRKGASSEHEPRQAIPNRIIQIGKDRQFSIRHRAVTSNIRLLNQDYDYLYYDNQQKDIFVRAEFPQYTAVYDSFRYPIQRYDFFRYLAVYRYGGFYFDMDVLLASSLTPLLKHGCVFPFEAISTSHYLRDHLGMDWQIGNYAFGAAPAHVFLEAVIENCVKSQRDPAWVKPMMRGTPPLRNEEFLVINSTGPGLVSRTFAENPALAKAVTVLMPEDVCDKGNWNRFGDWGVHLADSSWRPETSFLHQKVSGYLWKWIEYRRIQESRKRRTSTS